MLRRHSFTMEIRPSTPPNVTMFVWMSSERERERGKRSVSKRNSKEKAQKIVLSKSKEKI